MEKKLKSTIDNFIEELTKSEDGNKFIENIRNEIISGGKNIDPIVEDVLKVARKKSYSFSKEDFYDYIKDQLRAIAREDELNDDELSKASGGIGGGQVGKYATLFAGTAGLGGLAYSAFSGGLFGSSKNKSTSVAVKDKGSSKNKDKKLGKMSKSKKGLDDLDGENTSDEVKKLYKSKGAGSDYSPSSSSRLKRGSKKKIPSSGSYGMGRSSYGSPYSSSYSSDAAQGEASKVRNTLLDFLNKCSAELQRKGMNITPEQLYGAIMSGKLEEALGDKAEDFIFAIQNGNVDEAVSLVVSSLVKSPSKSENISKQPSSNEKYKNLKDNKEMSVEEAKKFLKDLENQAKEEREEDKKAERKVEKDDGKKEDIKPANIEENKDRNPADIKEKEENKEEKAEEKIKLYSISFGEEKAGKDAASIESFDAVYIKDETKPEEIGDWFKKIKENTGKERAIMFMGKDIKKIEEALKKVDKDIVISKNQKLGNNQIVAIVKDSTDKKVENFFSKTNPELKINIKGIDINKSSTLNAIAQEISEKIEKEKNNKKQEEKNKEELEKQRAAEESKKCLEDTINELTKGDKLAQLAMAEKDNNKVSEKSKNLLVVNSGADAEKIKERMSKVKNDVVVEIVEEKGKSQVSEILDKKEWQEIESKGWFTFDQAKTAKVFVRKEIANSLNNKNAIVEKFDVWGGFKENAATPIGSVKELVANIGKTNVENKRATDLKNQLQQKAKGTVAAKINADFVKEIKDKLSNNKGVALNVTFNHLIDQTTRKAAFIPENVKISGDQVKGCDFIVKKCNTEKESDYINQKQGLVSRFFLGELGNHELEEAEKFVALPTGEIEGKSTTVIFVKQNVISNYISNGKGREAIKNFLFAGEGKKYGITKDKEFDHYYTDNYSPRNEKYWDRIIEVYNNSEEFRKIINEYRDELSVESKKYDYKDYAKNFSDTLEAINSIK